MGVVGNLIIGMSVNPAGVSKGINAGRAQILGFSAQIQESVSSIGAMFAAGLAGAGIIGFFVKGAKAAADLNEQISATGVMFGQASSLIEADAQVMADKFGMVKSKYLESANAIASIAKGMTSTDSEAATLSIGLLHLAADLSSIRNVRFDEALGAIRSGLSGETEPLKRFMGGLNESAVKLEAMRLGLQHGNEELSEGAKMQARYSLITQGLSYAHGDLARTADSAANQGRAAWGRLENTMVEVGKSIQPITDALLNLANSGLNTVATKLKENQALFIEWAQTAADSIKAASDDTSTFSNALWLVGKLADVISAAFYGLRTVMDVFAMTLAGIGELLQMLIDNTLGWVVKYQKSTFFQGVMAGLSDQLKKDQQYALDNLKDLAGFGTEAAKSYDGVKNAATAAGQAGAQAGEQAAAGMKEANEAALKTSQAVNELTAKWQEEAATLGMTHRQAELKRLQDKGANPDELSRAQDLDRAMTIGEGFKKWLDDLASAAKSMIDSTQTPIEKYEAEMKRIGELVDAQMIDQTTAARAMIKARDEYHGKSEYKLSGGMEAGSQEARSALLAWGNQNNQSNDPLKEVARATRDGSAAELRIETILRTVSGRIGNMITPAPAAAF